ncbi:MAG: hypothetical protein ACJ75S_06945 [Solirubrobacterales bacterium]|jgi:hypothetical protein
MNDADRDRMVVGAMKTGLSKSDASVLVDISKHAFEHAVEAAIRVIDTAPPNLRTAALASVAGSWLGILSEHFPEHWKALKDQNVTPHMPTVIVVPPKSGSAAG